jgi:hypothetical protein
MSESEPNLANPLQPEGPLVNVTEIPSVDVPQEAGEQSVDEQRKDAVVEAFPPKLKSSMPTSAKSRQEPVFRDFLGEGILVPDIAASEFSMKDLGRAFGVSVRGTSHCHYGKPRQDAMEISSLSGPEGSKHTLLVLADGVGSAKVSEIGSNIAVQLTLSFFHKHGVGEPDDWSETSSRLVGHVQSGLMAMVEKLQVEERDISTTLRVLVIDHLSAETTRIRSASVGDGLSIEISATGDISNLEVDEADDPEITSTATVCLPSLTELAPVASVRVLENPCGVAAFTDGGWSIVHDGSDLIQAIMAKKSLAELTWRVDIDSAGRGDDRTIVSWWSA